MATRNFGDVLRTKLASDPDLKERVEEHSHNLDVASKLFNARAEAGLTQSELASRAETTQSVIARLEDAEYDGHSLKLLRRIADALGQRISLEFYPKAVPITATTSIKSYEIDWTPHQEWPLDLTHDLFVDSAG